MRWAPSPGDPAFEPRSSPVPALARGRTGAVRGRTTGLVRPDPCAEFIAIRHEDYFDRDGPDMRSEPSRIPGKRRVPLSKCAAKALVEAASSSSAFRLLPRGTVDMKKGSQHCPVPRLPATPRAAGISRSVAVSARGKGTVRIRGTHSARADGRIAPSGRTVGGAADTGRTARPAGAAVAVAT